MQKMFRLFLLVFIFNLFSCKDSIVNTGKQPLGKVVFETEHVNYAWRYYHQGSYAGEDGKFYTYDLAKANVQWKENSDGYYSEEELASKFHHFDTLRSVIPLDTIQWGYNLALLVNPNKYSDTLGVGADMGSSICSVYLFRSDRGRYQKIILNVEGDWRWYNASESAIILVQWLK